jgi:Fe-S cluster assembly ATPase SufC
MKLKTNKTSTKEPDKKYKIKKIRIEVEILTRVKLYFSGGEKKQRKKTIFDIS